jgi:PHP domain
MRPENHENRDPQLVASGHTSHDIPASQHAKRGLADLHMHTTYSDGSGTVEEVLSFAEKRTSLDVIAITDHDTIEGALYARDLVQEGQYRFDLIVGEEISTREGHLLALFLEKRIAPGMSIERSIDEVHAQGGIAVVAHPFNRVFRHSVQRSVMNRLLAQPEVHPDGVETLNGSFAGIGSSQLAMSLVRGVYRWAETGSSDAHTPTAIGCARTIFTGSTAEDVRASILSRQTSPIGTFWRTRDYIAFVSYRLKNRGGATSVREPARQQRRRSRVAQTA